MWIKLILLHFLYIKTLLPLQINLNSYICHLDHGRKNSLVREFKCSLDLVISLLNKLISQNVICNIGVISLEKDVSLSVLCWHFIHVCWVAFHLCLLIDQFWLNLTELRLYSVDNLWNNTFLVLLCYRMLLFFHPTGALWSLMDSRRSGAGQCNCLRWSRCNFWCHRHTQKRATWVAW